MVGRWSLHDNRLLVLDELTEGVDAASRTNIYSYIRSCAADGAAILVLSSSLEEIVDVCDRAVLLSNGRLVRDIRNDELTVAKMETMLMIDPENGLHGIGADRSQIGGAA
jgi:ribose transport system ATP-binding protein